MIINSLFYQNTDFPGQIYMLTAITIKVRVQYLWFYKKTRARAIWRVSLECQTTGVKHNHSLFCLSLASVGWAYLIDLDISNAKWTVEAVTSYYWLAPMLCFYTVATRLQKRNGTGHYHKWLCSWYNHSQEGVVPRVVLWQGDPPAREGVAARAKGMKKLQQQQQQQQVTTIAGSLCVAVKEIVITRVGKKWAGTFMQLI